MATLLSFNKVSTNRSVTQFFDYQWVINWKLAQSTIQDIENIKPISHQGQVSETETQHHKPAVNEAQQNSPNCSQDKSGVSKPTLILKNFDKVNYLIGKPPQKGSEISGSGGIVGASQEGHALSDEEKRKLEEAGRHLAIRELKNMGYSVEEMPIENPGFDLLAIRNDQELRIEVKAHKGRATVVDVTQRQYKEYLGQHDYKWELWNIEHLVEADTDPVMITKYADIPDEALDARTFRVDLKKCNSPYNQPSINYRGKNK